MSDETRQRRNSSNSLGWQSREEKRLKLSSRRLIETNACIHAKEPFDFEKPVQRCDNVRPASCRFLREGEPHEPLREEDGLVEKAKARNPKLVNGLGDPLCPESLLARTEALK